MPRERISNFSKWTMLIVAAVFDLLMLILGWIPPIGSLLAGMWGFILGIWLIFIGGTLSKRFTYIATLLAFQIVSAIVAIFPFLGGIFAFLLTCVNTLVLYWFINIIQEEDREYNKKQGLA